ncbi:ketoacyl-ACP synthase III family protein [Saccharopolyspora phatthalungensis]|uniref:3-oxoacyl-[acyl-carrier-protein] synthase-3/clorobiocin biosynthesis protein CloN2 n=1 Tax=Saccharopolyspora phatthalungensis TaxID=664693 RepID=A0A840QKZ2_9PSEU|nr:ketoacyl-ACP synthase III family protein [Saccharopolyspora phatthalungensis]MBB5159933.1 3-oxoacyl-[acyl-carrier-protein] synthase-3/clorobiocin biosynthesis protein CloN2 [Saccharopolyspora phatthalungensis]
MRASDMFISGLGAYVPDQVSVADAVRQGWYSDELSRLQEFVSIAVAGGISAPEMALRAARDAIEGSAHAPDELDLLLYCGVWHQGPDGWQPQYLLQRELIGGDALAVEIQHGCNGLFSALSLAVGHLHADRDQRAALLVGTDNFGTPLIDRWSVSTAFVVADAASALVLSKKPSAVQLLSVNLLTVPEGEQTHRSGEPLFPPGATVGRVLDFNARAEHFQRASQRDSGGTLMSLKIRQRLLQTVHRTLVEAGIDISDISRVACAHYSRELVEQWFLSAVNMPLSRSTWNYGRTIGHAGCSDQFLALRNLIVSGQVHQGDHVLLLGVGPGITIAAAVVRIADSVK